MSINMMTDQTKERAPSSRIEEKYYIRTHQCTYAAIAILEAIIHFSFSRIKWGGSVKKEANRCVRHDAAKLHCKM